MLIVIPDFQCYFGERLRDGRCLSRFKVLCIAWFVCKVCVGVCTSCISCAQNSCEILFVCVCSRSCILHSHNSYEMLCVCMYLCMCCVLHTCNPYKMLYACVYLYNLHMCSCIFHLCAVLCACPYVHAPASFICVIHKKCFVCQQTQQCCPTP